MEESGLILILVKFFVGEKEESSIVTVVEFGYPYRPTDAAAEIMPAVLRPEQMAIAAIGEGQSGSEVFVRVWPAGDLEDSRLRRQVAALLPGYVDERHVTIEARR